MIKLEDKQQALNKVLDSVTFKKSTTINVLLKYLVTATLEGKEISVYSIGEELFGKNYEPEKSDVNIRVNISHLRKRLNKYYENEGQHDAVRIEIEPGQYAVTFTEKIPEQQKRQKKNYAIVALAVLVLSVFVIFKINKPTEGVWRPMFANEYETTLYLGDVFGYSGPNAFGSNGWHRNPGINSVEEFYEQTKKNPDKYKDLTPGRYSYVVFENSYNIKPFTQYFTQNDYDFTIRPGADFKIRSIKGRNSIYAGPVYVHNKFKELFNDFSNNVEIKGQQSGGYIYYKKDIDTLISVNINNRNNEGEYAIASAFNGSDGTRHYIFFSNHGMGLTALVEYFTDNESLTAFSDEYLSLSDEFVALFFVKGKDRTSLSIELEHFDDNR